MSQELKIRTALVGLPEGEEKDHVRTLLRPGIRETLIFTCSGGSHAGQVANRAGGELMKEKEGRLFCIAAVAAGVAEKLERARGAKIRIAIDGCDDRCCLKVLEAAGLPPHAQVATTDLGVERMPKEPHMLEDVKRTVSAVKERLASLRSW